MPPREQRRRATVGAFIDGGAHITDSIIFPGVRVGPHARIHHAIIDKNVDVPPMYQIGVDAAADAARFTVSPRDVVVLEKGRKLFP